MKLEVPSVTWCQAPPRREGGAQACTNTRAEVRHGRGPAQPPRLPKTGPGARPRAPRAPRAYQAYQAYQAYRDPADRMTPGTG